MQPLRRRHGAAQLSPGARAAGNNLYRGLANGLTLGRFAAPAPFVYLLFEAHGGASGHAGALLFLVYLLTASTDLLDGWFARKAGSGSARWGRLDVLADVWFNTSALLAAAWLGLLGYWVPAGVVALAAQYLYRNSRQPAGTNTHLREDRPGKLAGVIYYLLAGGVVLNVWLDPGRPSRWLDWTGNAVFVYTALVFAGNVCRTRKPSSVHS